MSETSPGASGFANPAGWPDAILAVIRQAVTVEYTSLTRDGRPITVPVTPYVGPEGRTLDVSTGLTYPAKAERARRNPKVSLLYADPVGSGLTNPPVVLVQGLATVRDADLQANTDRYVREAMAKTPEAYRGQPRFLIRRLDWYFARIWIAVTPLHLWWWPSSALDQPPSEWIALEQTTAPPSDPAPEGKPPPAWLEPPSEWRASAQDALARLEQRDLSWVGPDGFPLSAPVVAANLHPDGFSLRVGSTVPAPPGGPACLVCHSYPARFTGQENRTFVGELISSGAPDGELVLRVDRLLADVSLAGNRLAMTLDFLGKGRRLAPRLRSEAARRHQPVPSVRLPREQAR